MGFALVWAVYGALASTLLVVVHVPPIASTTALLVSAIAWQLSAARQQALNRCPRIKIAAPGGGNAAVGSFRAGIHQAGFCLRTGWTPMLRVAAASHPAVSMAVAGAYYSEWIPGRNPFVSKRRFRPVVGYAATLPLIVAVSH